MRQSDKAIAGQSDKGRPWEKARPCGLAGPFTQSWLSQMLWFRRVDLYTLQSSGWSTTPHSTQQDTVFKVSELIRLGKWIGLRAWLQYHASQCKFQLGR